MIRQVLKLEDTPAYQHCSLFCLFSRTVSGFGLAELVSHMLTGVPESPTMLGAESTVYIWIGQVHFSNKVYEWILRGGNCHSIHIFSNNAHHLMWQTVMTGRKAIQMLYFIFNKDKVCLLLYYKNKLLYFIWLLYIRYIHILLGKYSQNWILTSAAAIMQTKLGLNKYVSMWSRFHLMLIFGAYRKQVYEWHTLYLPIPICLRQESRTISGVKALFTRQWSK